MYSKGLKHLIAGITLACGVAASASAAPITFDIVWSGASFNNNASATGSITFDPTVTIDIGFEASHPLPGSNVTALTTTITGTSGADGTYGLGSYNSFYFAAPSALDLSRELVGQVMANGCRWGTSRGICGSRAGGDFNLFGAPASGSYYFQLTAASGENMLLTSLRPRAAVPEPGSITLLALGLASVGAMRRKAKKT